MKKRIIAWAITTALLAALPVSAFAGTPVKTEIKKEQTLKIDLESIETIMTTQGRYFESVIDKKERLLKNQRDIKKKIELYKREEDKQERGFGNAEAISTAYDELRGAKNEMELAKISAAAELRKQIFTARQEYLTYFLLKEEEKLLEEKAQRLESKNETARKKLERGLISEREYEDGIRTAKNASQAAEEHREKLRRQEDTVKDAMGLRRDQSVALLDPPAPQVGTLEKISRETARIEAAAHSPELLRVETKLKQLRSGFMRDRQEIRDTEKEKKTVLETLEREFSDQYDQLEKAVKTLETARENAAAATAEAKRVEEKFGRGLIAKNVWTEAAEKQAESESAMRSAELSVTAEYLKLLLIWKG